MTCEVESAANNTRHVCSIGNPFRGGSSVRKFLFLVPRPLIDFIVQQWIKSGSVLGKRLVSWLAPVKKMFSVDQKNVFD